MAEGETFLKVLEWLIENPSDSTAICQPVTAESSAKRPLERLAGLDQEDYEAVPSDTG